jgi:hypothetical protein
MILPHTFINEISPGRPRRDNARACAIRISPTDGKSPLQPNLILLRLSRMRFQLDHEAAGQRIDPLQAGGGSEGLKGEERMGKPVPLVQSAVHKPSIEAIQETLLPRSEKRFRRTMVPRGSSCWSSTFTQRCI